MVGVCMKYAQHNYGGMLQAQALCIELEKRGIDYQLIRYQRRDSVFTKIKYIPRLLNRILLEDKKNLITKQIHRIRNSSFRENDVRRGQAFDSYSSHFFKKLSPVYIGYRELTDGAGKYSAVIVGSDQLWSPAGLPTNFYNLMFVPQKTRKISIASSFGVSKIPWYQKKRTAAYLRRIEYISMRENRGSEIVYELTGRTVPVIADPVFFLSRQEWEKIIPVRKLYDEPYIFAYLLGSQSEYRRIIRDFAIRNHLKIVFFPHVDQYIADAEGFGDYAPYDVAPDKFLNIIRGAQFVFTDSFHGVCFSVIHQKEFVIFDRYAAYSKVSKNSRIDSLCDNLGISAKRYKGDLEKNISFKIDYKALSDRMENMIRTSSEYLDAALSGIS